MEENAKPMWRISLNFGLVTGLIIIIFNLIMYLLDLSTDPDAGWLNLLVYAFLIGGMVWGAKAYRDIHNAGFASYGQAFSAAFLVGLFASILSAVFTYLLYKFDPSLIDKMIMIAEERIYEQGLEGEQLEQALAIQSKFTSPLVISIMSLIWITVVNVIAALIIAAFIKREDSSLQTGI